MLTSNSKSTRLSGMMFFQYAIWGAWLPVTARYLSATIEEGGLGFSGSQIGMILGLLKPSVTNLTCFDVLP